MDSPRVSPLAPDELSSEQREFLEPFTNKRGQYPNVFGTLARHMDLVNAWSTFGLYMLRESQLDPVHREVLILRTAILIGSEYEWHQHQKIAERLGVSGAELDHIRNGDPFDDPHKSLMMACANDLARDHKLGEDTWVSMVDTFGLTYVLDAIFTVGAYTALGMALNSCGVEVERDA